MISELRLLIDLQKNLERQKIIKEEFENPSILKDLKKVFEEIQKEKEEREKNIKEMEEKIASLEAECQQKKEEIRAFRQQLQLVKTQKEYSQTLNAIDNIQKVLSSKEDEALKLMEKLENEKKILEEKKIGWEPIEKEYEEALKKWEEIKMNYENELKDLELQEKIIKQNLPKNYLALFERIYKLRKGQAVVPVSNGSCSGCNVLLRPQQYADVMAGNEIIQCDNCQRILYIE